jgi:hypothetical protein
VLAKLLYKNRPCQGLRSSSRQCNILRSGSVNRVNHVNLHSLCGVVVRGAYRGRITMSQLNSRDRLSSKRHLSPSTCAFPGICFATKEAVQVPGIISI